MLIIYANSPIHYQSLSDCAWAACSKPTGLWCSKQRWQADRLCSAASRDHRKEDGTQEVIRSNSKLTLSYPQNLFFVFHSLLTSVQKHCPYLPADVTFDFVIGQCFNSSKFSSRDLIHLTALILRCHSDSTFTLSSSKKKK